MKTKTKLNQRLITLTAQQAIWRTTHPTRPAPSVQGRQWYSAAYTLPREVSAVSAIVINGEPVYTARARRSSGVLSCGGTWKMTRRMIDGEYVCLSIELQNAPIKKIRKKATKIAIVSEVL